MPGTSPRNRFLVLGAGGKVGRMLARIWKQAPPSGWEPVFQFRSGAPDDGVTWQVGDNPDALPEVSAILALWGVTAGDREQLGVNTRLATEALHLAQRLNAERAIICSSSAVYAPGAGLSEDDPGALVPGTSYGKAKLEMERAITADLAKLSDPPETVILRMANFVGADSLFGTLGRGDRVTLDRFADGAGPLRSYLAPGDFAAAVVALLNLAGGAWPDVLNLAGQKALAMEDLAHAAGAEIKWRPAPESAVKTVALDTTRLTGLIGPLEASSNALCSVEEWRRWGAAQ